MTAVASGTSCGSSGKACAAWLAAFSGGAGVDRCAELLHEAEVIAVVPDLRDLAVAVETEDVHAIELGALAGCRHVAPVSGMGAGGGPADGDEVAFAKDEVDPPAGGRGRRGGTAPRSAPAPRLVGSATCISSPVAVLAGSPWSPVS
jgi:hypothetical protein